MQSLNFQNFEKMKFKVGSETDGVDMSIREAADGSKYYEVKSVADGSEAWKKGIYRFWKVATINGEDPMTTSDEGDENLWEKVSRGDDSFTMTFIVIILISFLIVSCLSWIRLLCL